MSGCSCGVVREERGQGLFELVATKLPNKKETLICPMLLPARVVAGASGPTRFLVSTASTSALSRPPVPAWFCTSRQPKPLAVVRTAVSSRSGRAAGRSGSMTPRVSGGRCGCCGPNVSGAARTPTVPEPRSPKNTLWQDRGRNSRPGPLRGRPTACSASIPPSPPWPTSSASPGTRPGTPSRQRLPDGSQRPAGWQG